MQGRYSTTEPHSSPPLQFLRRIMLGIPRIWTKSLYLVPLGSDRVAKGETNHWFREFYSWGWLSAGRMLAWHRASLDLTPSTTHREHRDTCLSSQHLAGRSRSSRSVVWILIGLSNKILESDRRRWKLKDQRSRAASYWFSPPINPQTKWVSCLYILRLNAVSTKL